MHQVIGKHEVHDCIAVGAVTEVLFVVATEGHVDSMVMVEHGCDTVKAKAIKPAAKHMLQPRQGLRARISALWQVSWFTFFPSREIISSADRQRAYIQRGHLRHPVPGAGRKGRGLLHCPHQCHLYSSSHQRRFDSRKRSVSQLP